MSVSSLAARWESVARIDPMFSGDPTTRYRYLLSLMDQARTAIAQVDRTGYTTRDALASEPAINQAVSERAPYWAAQTIGSYLSVDLGMKIESRTYRDWILLQYDKAAAGVPYLHPDMLSRILQTGKVEEGWTIDDWQRRCRTFMVLIRANEDGALDPIKTGTYPVEGLGIAWGIAVPVIIVIVVLAIIAAAAWIISESEKTSQMNQYYQRVINQVCTDSQGNWRSTAECQAAVQNAMDTDRDKTQMQLLVEQGVKYGAVILGVYVLARVFLARVDSQGGGRDIVIRTGAK